MSDQGFSLTQFSEEFARLKQQPVILQLGGWEAWALLAQIQLACRHPENNGPTRQVAEQIARQIQAAVATTPALAAMAEMGWNPRYDQEVLVKEKEEPK
jgi:hypothetical protein